MAQICVSPLYMTYKPEIKAIQFDVYHKAFTSLIKKKKITVSFRAQCALRQYVGLVKCSRLFIMAVTENEIHMNYVGKE